MAWDDVIALASCDSNNTVNNFPHRIAVTCTQSGNCTKIRLGVRFFSGSADDIKVALFDASFNLLGQGAVTGVSPGTGTYQEVTLDTPVAVTSGTYYIGYVNAQTNFIQIGFLDASGSLFVDFGSNYASFPPDPFTGSDNTSRTYAVGMWVESGGAITRYVNTASAGGDGTTNALSGANAAFASLRAAMSTFWPALTGPTLILCEGVAADTLGVTQAYLNFQTTATNYLEIRGNNTTGKYSTSHYRIELTDEKAIYNNNLGHVRLVDLQVQITITTSAAATYDAFRLATANNENGPVDHRYERCIAKFVISGGATDNGFGFIDSDPTSGGTCRRINCIAYGGNAGFNSAWGAGVTNYNCTSYGNEFNYLDPQTCVNCISANPTSGPGFGFYNTGSTGHAFNASDDATAVGMGPRTNQTFSFVNAAAGDFHLLSTDQGAKGFGLTDPASGLYDDDIDGQPRVGDWDIGADESPDPARIIFEKAS